MNRNNRQPSKFDEALKFLKITANAVTIIAGGVLLAVIIYGAIKIYPFLSHNKTDITVDNINYSKAIESWQNGNYLEAEAGFLSALDEAKNQYGEDDLVTAQIHQKLGALYNEMIKYDDAIEHFNHALVVFRKKLGNDDGMTIITRAQIGSADIHLGNYEQGFRELNDAFDDCSSIDYKAQIAQSLAQCHTETGNYDKAEQWYDVLEELYVQLYGETTKGYAVLTTFWNDRAILYSEVGDAHSAIQYFDMAQSYWMKAHDVTSLSRSTLSSYGDKELANILINEAIEIVQSGGELSIAWDLVDKAVIICENRFGENNAETARCYSAISGVYNAMRDKSNEIIYLDKALSISLKTVGENSELSASIYNSIGNYYVFWGDYETSIPYFEKAIDIRRNILAYDNLMTVYIYCNIANAKNLQYDFEGATEAARTAVNICEGLVGKDNLHAAAVYIELCRPLINTNQYTEATELINKAINICNNYSPGKTITEAFAYQYQMKMYLRQEKYEEALSSAEISLELFRNLQGDNNSNTGDAYLYLGDIYVLLVDATKADDVYAKAAVICKNIYNVEDIHEAMDERIKNLIALESIDTDSMSYQEIEDKISELSDTISEEQITSRYSLWGVTL